MNKNLVLFIIILAVVLRLMIETQITWALVFGMGSILTVYLLTKNLFREYKNSTFPLFCALFLGVSSWYISLVKFPTIYFQIFLITLGIYCIIKFFKSSSVISTIFLLMVLMLFNSVPNSLKNILSSTQVPIWTTDEQRREHGKFYNHPSVVFIHNKVTNYTLSFLDHYALHFEGSFLFGDGKMYFFDFIFITLALVSITRKPKRWGVIFLWLFLSPIPSALDFQPPNALKAASMVVPLTILSSFGAYMLFKTFYKYIIRLK